MSVSLLCLFKTYASVYNQNNECTVRLGQIGFVDYWVFSWSSSVGLLELLSIPALRSKFNPYVFRRSITFRSWFLAFIVILTQKKTVLRYFKGQFLKAFSSWYFYFFSATFVFLFPIPICLVEAFNIIIGGNKKNKKTWIAFYKNLIKFICKYF